MRTMNSDVARWLCLMTGGHSGRRERNMVTHPGNYSGSIKEVRSGVSQFRNHPAASAAIMLAMLMLAESGRFLEVTTLKIGNHGILSR
jgi:hypothetical protein